MPRPVVTVYGGGGAGGSGRNSVFAAAAAWATGRNPWARLGLLLGMTWVFWRHLRDTGYNSLLGGLNLGIHELGHVVFSPFGQFLAIAGGTLLQCAAPIIAGVLFWRQRDYFAIAFALCWLGTNFFAIAPYAADAIVQELPLVSVGSGEPIHDWGYMLGRLGWMHHATTVGGLFRAAGASAMLCGLLAGGWLVWQNAAHARGGT